MDITIRKYWSAAKSDCMSQKNNNNSNAIYSNIVKQMCVKCIYSIGNLCENKSQLCICTC